MFAEEKAEERKYALIAASFTAWQMKDTGKTFDDYIRAFGLGEKKAKINDKMKKQLIERNIDLAERIRKASLKQRNKSV